MIEKYSIRTDLALEQKERFESDNVEVQGVVLEEEYDEEREIKITKVIIETENGAKTMGKPVGTYITLEAPNLMIPDEDYHREISGELAKIVCELIKEKKKEYDVLVIGLGNREVTPDALGPYVVDNLIVTRHIIREYGKYAMGEENVNQVSAIVPGVMGQTGMETVEVVRDCKGDEAGFYYCGRCFGGAKYKKTEPDNTGGRYGNPPGFRRWQSQRRNYAGDIRNSGYRYRCAYCCGRSDDCQ